MAGRGGIARAEGAKRAKPVAVVATRTGPGVGAAATRTGGATDGAKRRRPARLCWAVGLGILIVGINLLFGLFLPDGVYVGDFNGSFPKGLAYGWQAQNHSVIERGGLFESGPGRSGFSQVVDLRGATEPAGLYCGYRVAAEAVLRVWYRVEADGGARDGSASAGSASGGSAPGVLTSGPGLIRVSDRGTGLTRVAELTSSGAWTECLLAVSPGWGRMDFEVSPGWRVSFDDISVTADGPLAGADALRARLWGQAANKPSTGGSRLDFFKVVSAGRQADVALPVAATLMATMVLYGLLLRLSYRGGVILLFATASIVLFEPSPFEALFAIWLVHSWRRRGLDFRPLADRRLRPVVVGLALLALGLAVGWVAGGPGTLSTASAMITGYCLVVFVAAATGVSSGTLVVDVLIGLGLGALLGTLYGWLGFAFEPLRTAVLQYGTEFRGFFKDSNVYGPSLFLPATASLLLGLLSRSRPKRVAWLAAALFFAGGVVMSGSRAAFGGLMVATAVAIGLVFPHLGHRVRAAGPFVAGAALVAAIAVGIRGGLGGSLLELRWYDLEGRFPDILIGLKAISTVPLGAGPGLGVGRYGISPHNLFVLTFLEEGWIGGVGLLLAFGALVWFGWRAAGRLILGRPPNHLLIAVLASFVGYLAVSMFVSSLHWRHLWILGGLVVTLALGPRDRTSQGRGRMLG